MMKLYNIEKLSWDLCWLHTLIQALFLRSNKPMNFTHLWLWFICKICWVLQVDQKYSYLHHSTKSMCTWFFLRYLPSLLLSWSSSLLFLHFGAPIDLSSRWHPNYVKLLHIRLKQLFQDISSICSNLCIFNCWSKRWQDCS